MVGGEVAVHDHVRAVEEVDQNGRRAPVADALERAEHAHGVAVRRRRQLGSGDAAALEGGDQLEDEARLGRVRVMVRVRVTVTVRARDPNPNVEDPDPNPNPRPQP